MARAALLERLGLRREPLVWRTAIVRSVVEETARARTLELDVDGWTGHRAGQHVDVRLTAEDGYQASRSYSLASAPSDRFPALTVELVDDGELSPWFVSEARPGDMFEIRGPVGGHFVWEPSLGGPLLLVAGGSGLVPLMSMLREAGSTPAHLLLSARTWDDVLYRDELDEVASRPSVRTCVTLTRSAPPDWRGARGRIDASMLTDLGPAPSARPRVYVCGPTAFVEAAADLLVRLGHDPSAIRAERFGPTGTSG